MDSSLYDIEFSERTLAVVLLDLIGSTSFVQRYGAQDAALHFQFHDRLTRTLIYRFDGREIDRSDGFLCSFDRIVDAVNFSLHYQRAVPPKTKLGCRIGIHWGSIIEVKQDAIFVAANAKRIELEGISKNIAARTMSICGAGQVLLTKEAMYKVKRRTNKFTPKGTSYACVGLYRFKGVKEPQVIYAVGETIESLQPPKGTDKVKRLGGPKKIQKRAKDRVFWEWAWWAYYRIGILVFIYLLVTLVFPIFSNPTSRSLFGLEGFEWVDSLLQGIDRVWRFIRHGQ
jgi:class 3 adenylate cyclase